MELIQEQMVIPKIQLIRNQNVILDFDLAEMFGIETKVLNQAVKRNLQRFLNDYIFLLTTSELRVLRSQIVTSKIGANRYLPNAFTKQGVAMLSSVLRSETAILVNVEIIRTFSRLRQMALDNKDNILKLEQLKNKAGDHEQEIATIISALKQLQIHQMSRDGKLDSRNQVGGIDYHSNHKQH